MFNVTASGDLSGVMGAVRRDVLICDMEPVIKDLFTELSNDCSVVLFQIKIFDVDGGHYILATIGDDSYKNELENPDNWSGDGSFGDLPPGSTAFTVKMLSDRLRAGFYKFFPDANPAWWMMWQWVTPSSSEVDTMGWNVQDPIGRDPEI